MASTTTILNSSEISDMKEDICFINLSTLLSLPVWNMNGNGNNYYHNINNNDAYIEYVLIDWAGGPDRKIYYHLAQGHAVWTVRSEGHTNDQELNIFPSARPNSVTKHFKVVCILEWTLDIKTRFNWRIQT